MYRMQTVDSLACSHDGMWVAYVVTRADRESDERKSTVWMVDWQGKESVRLSSDSESASTPAFSPDGRWISYLAQRGLEGKSQLFVLDRRGGEAQPVTNVSGDILEYQWSPDGRSIVLSIASGDEAGGESTGANPGAGSGKSPRPIVIDRLRFKQDRDDGTGKKGYITDADRPQLQLLDLATRTLAPLTDDPHFDDTTPAWSPDARRIAFLSSREGDLDRTGLEELYVIDARAGATPRRLAQFYAPQHASVLWSPDGRSILHTVGVQPRWNAYIQDRLAQVDLAGGEDRILAPQLDRPVSLPILVGARSSEVAVLVDDDRSSTPVSIEEHGTVTRKLLRGPVTVSEQCTGANHLAVLASTDNAPPEIHALEAGKLRRLSAHNDALMAELRLGSVEDFEFRGADGEAVHGLMTKPPGFVAGRRYPTILWIHGGPDMQDAHGLAFDNYPLQVERQWLAAHGYLVLAVNYHGSSGRGQKFAASIAGDWGDKEVKDLLAAVDAVVQAGLADPERLGIGGWSYGGILTDYTIASDTRFRAAISGAGSANQLSMFGSDEYVLQYNAELGPPWEQADTWMRLSYPFFHAERIRTPTLFLGGDKDFNVPLAGGEQMYEALRVRNVPTRLVVYPGEPHLFERPSFIKDRWQRYADWFEHYLNPGQTVIPPP